MTDNNNDDDDAQKLKSPRIKDLKWGYMEIEGYPSGKDFKLFPGGAEVWDWNKTNTRHIPGIQKEDVEDLINKGAKYIILSKGMENRLQTPKETEEFLREKNLERDVHYFIEPTEEARDHYNKLVDQNKPVGALIHSTC